MNSSGTGKELFQLVHSMTPTEKRHFRLANPGNRGRSSKSEEKKDKSSGGNKNDENQFILLFDIVEKQDELDEVLAMKRLKIADRNRFSRIKNYLYKALLESLEDYYRESSADAQFFHLINQAQILINRRLYQPASRLLNKASKLAAEKGNGTYGLIVLTLEMDRLTRSEHLDGMEHSLRAYEDQKSELVQRSADYLDLHMIKSKATWLLRREDPKKQHWQEWLQELAEHPLLKELKYPEDTEFTLYHYNLNGLINGLLGKPEEDYRNRLAYLNTYKDNVNFIQRWPINYIIALGNVAGSAARMGNFQELLECTTEMRQFMDRLNIKNRSSLDPIVEVRSHALELDAYPVQSAAEQRKLNEQLEEIYHRCEGDMAEIWQIIVRHGIGRYHFWNQSWDKALEWLGPVVHQSDDKLYPEMQISCRLMYTLSHFELGNDRFLSSYLPKLKQWLRQNGQQWEGLLFLFQQLRQAIQQQSRSFSAEQLNALAAHFARPVVGQQTTAEEQNHSHLLELLNLEHWIDIRLKKVKLPV